MFYIVFGLKPCIDAARVLRDNASTRDSSDMFDPLTVMTMSKGIHIFAQSLPAGVLQTYAVIIRNSSSVAPILSICMSCLSTANTSTNISYDFDSKLAARVI